MIYVAWADPFGPSHVPRKSLTTASARRTKSVLLASLPRLFVHDRTSSIVIAVPGGISWSRIILQEACQSLRVMTPLAKPLN
jgi:hypothetical protein